MRTAINLGLRVRREHGIAGVATESDVDGVLADLSLVVVEDWAFRSLRLRAMRVGDAIYLRGGLTSGWRTALKSHECGHVLLHVGSYLYLAVPNAEHMRNRREREAQAFAGALVVGEPFVVGFDDRLMEAFEVGIPPEFLFGYATAINYAAPPLGA